MTSMLRALEKAAVVALMVQTGGTRLAWVLRWVGWQPQTLPEPGGTFSRPPWDVSSEISKRWSQFEALDHLGLSGTLQLCGGKCLGLLSCLVHLGLSRAGVYPSGALGTGREHRPASASPLPHRCPGAFF